MKKISNFKLSILPSLIIPLLLFIPILNARAETTIEELSLNQAVHKVLAHFPRLKAEEFKVLVAKARQKEAVSGYLPRLGADFNMTQGDDPVYVFSSLLKQQRFTQDNFAIPALNEPSSLTNYQTALELSLPIFSGFQTEGRVRATGFDMKAAQSIRENFTQEAAFLALSSYVGILSFEKSLSLTQEAVNQGDAAVKEADSLKEKGMVLGCDYLTAKAILSQIKQQKKRLNYRKNAMQGSLNILMGSLENTDLRLASLFPPAALPALDDAALKKDALELRQDKKALEYRFQGADAEFAREKNSRLPTVDAFARGEDNTNKFTSSGDNYLVGLRVHLNLFDPPLGEKLNQRKAEAEHAKSQVAQIKDDISNDLQQALHEYHSQDEILNLMGQSVKDAQQATLSIEELYKAGKRTIADVLKAHIYQLELETTYWNARYKAYLTYARLQLLSGHLNDAAISNLEAMLVKNQGEF